MDAPRDGKSVVYRTLVKEGKKESRRREKGVGRYLRPQKSAVKETIQGGKGERDKKKRWVESSP